MPRRNLRNGRSDIQKLIITCGYINIHIILLICHYRINYERILIKIAIETKKIHGPFLFVSFC